MLAAAQQAGLPAFTSTPAAGGGQTYSLSLQTLLLMTALSMLPAALMMMTSFTRIIIVLSLLRQAIGTQSAPPNQVMVGLALFLTLFVMAPVFDKIYVDAYQPLSENKITMTQALDKGVAPLKTFMMKQTRQADLALYVKLSNSAPLRGPEDVIPDQLRHFYSLPDYRHGGGQCLDVDGDDDDVACGGIAAVQADAVRFGRWLAAFDRIAGAEFLLAGHTVGPPSQKWLSI